MLAMPRLALFALVLCLGASAFGAEEIGIRVTVFDEKSGEHRAGLAAKDFEVTDDKKALRVESANRLESPVDILLLADTSMVGEIVRPLVPAFIDQLEENEQMAIVTYADGADLAQDFTSSKQLLQEAVSSPRYGNAPRVLDAVFAAVDSGFESSAGRRAVVLLSAGVEGRSRSAQFDVIALARERGVSVYSVFVNATDRGLFKAISRRTGGAYFHSKQLDLDPKALAALVFRAVRGQYELSVSGAYSIGSRVAVKVVGGPKSNRKLVATALVLE